MKRLSLLLPLVTVCVLLPLVTVCVQWRVWTVARAAFSPGVAETHTTAPSRSEYTGAAPMERFVSMNKRFIYAGFISDCTVVKCTELYSSEKVA